MSSTDPQTYEARQCIRSKFAKEASVMISWIPTVCSACLMCPGGLLCIDIVTKSGRVYCTERQQCTNTERYSIHRANESSIPSVLEVSACLCPGLTLLTYPVSFCRTIPPLSPVCFPVFPPSTTNRSSWKNWLTTVCL